MAEKRGYGSFEVVREGADAVLRVDFNDAPFFPSVEDSPYCMGKVVDELAKNSSITKVVFYQKRDYEYDAEQVQLLAEVARLYSRLLREPGLDASSLGDMRAYADIKSVVYNLLRSDPVGAFVELRRALRSVRMVADKTVDKARLDVLQKYLSVVERLFSGLERTRVIALARPYIAGYVVGDRSVYRQIFHPSVKPDFMFTKLMAAFPIDGEEIAAYSVSNTDVTVFSVPDSVQYLYHVVPPEFKLSEEKYELLDSARRVIAEHKPQRQEFVDPERMRQVFFNVGHDLIDELASKNNVKLRASEIDELTNILVRYTVGFGLTEVLLADMKIQDITINSPMGRLPVFVVHEEFDECFTNIIPTVTEAESWASKLRMISGRPLDEANPILDADFNVPGARARVSVISPPINPSGLAYAFRRHRDKPWTLPLFMKNRMLSPLAAGMLSFFIDGSRTMLVAGTRSAGKTSLLGSLMTEIMRKRRIITIEDTLELPSAALRDMGYNIQSMKVASAMTRGTNEVSADEGIRTTLRMGDSCLIVGEVRSSLRGDQEVMVVKYGLAKRVAIKDLENVDLKSVCLPTLTGENNMELKQVSGFVKHPKRNQLVKLSTKTGRSVVVTPDHSVFTHVNFKVAAINTDHLKPGDPIIIPSKIPNGFNDMNYMNLLEIFREEYRIENAEQYVRRAVKVLGWKRASKICGVSDIYRYLLSTQKTRIPVKSFLELMREAKIMYSLDGLRIKKGTSNSIPAKFPINENITRLIGYYLAEGNIDASKIQITNSKPEIIEDIKYVCKNELGLGVSQRIVKGYGSSVQLCICSKPLLDLLVYLGCGKTSFQKRIPEFIYGLGKKKVCALLRGMFSGDGSISSTKKGGNMIRYFSTSKRLVEDVSYALLSLGIVCRLHSQAPRREGRKEVFIAEIKQRKYVECFLEEIGFTHKKPKIILKSFAHSKDDSVSFDPQELEKHLKLPRRYRHLRKTRCCSKDYLKRVTECVKCSDELYNFVHGDFFIDRVKSVEVINLSEPEYVYDLAVESTQRFIGGFGGILLHNTEAKALYEAMRIGAMANVVAGTIHGDSPYGVFDRVVNDLGVPKTSFKATDIIVVANPVRSADSMHRWRRITQITEVGKFWENDPLREHGFRDLMKYDSRTDQLEPTPDLINGESDVLKAIAGNVKEWAGSWDALWDNVLLRAKVKQAIADYSVKAGMPEMLEANFVIGANDEFHRASDRVREEIGAIESKRVFLEWEDWLKRSIKRMKLR